MTDDWSKNLAANPSTPAVRSLVFDQSGSVASAFGAHQRQTLAPTPYSRCSAIEVPTFEKIGQRVEKPKAGCHIVEQKAYISSACFHVAVHFFSRRKTYTYGVRGMKSAPKHVRHDSESLQTYADAEFDEEFIFCGFFLKLRHQMTKISLPAI